MTMRTLTKALTGTAVVGALLTGGLVTPAINSSPVAEAAGVTLPTASAEAAWWHFTVRKWGAHCGFVWLGGDRYEVKRQAYGWTSDHPTCQRTGKTIILRNR